MSSSGGDSGHRWTASGINIGLPTIDIDFRSITEALNPRNFNLAAIDDLMSTTKCGNRVKDTTCQSCDVKFTVFKRKRTCFDCNMDFCSNCLNKDITHDRRNHCKRCIVFNTVPLERNALNGLRVKDLKWFLAAKRIPAQMCKEKSELVDLILERFSPQASTSSQYDRRFDNYNTERSVLFGQEMSYSQPSNEPNVETHSDSNQTIPSSDVECDEHKNMEQKDDKSKIYFNIDDVESVDQLRSLSIKQLKLILTRNFIDYKGCLERKELLARVERLWNDRQENRQNIDISDEDLCKICMEERIDCVLLECGHVVTCTQCGKRLNECPICRQYVIRVVHTFKS